MKRIIPRHIHFANEILSTKENVLLSQIPPLDWTRMAFDTLAGFITQVGNIAWTYITKTASDIMATISTWANILTQVGALTVAQITTTLTSWANTINALGNIAWSYVTKTAQNVMDTLVSWANMVTIWGNIAWSQITKTASDIMTTISTWANILAQIGAQTVAQITTTLTNWATVISSLGNLAWSYVTKTASDIMTTISSWANIVSTVGAMSVAQIGSVLTSWANLVNGSALGNLMGGIIKIGTGTIQWLSDLIWGYNTSNAKLDTDKLNLPPYKLTTSAYNYVVNGGFEYGTWGGDEAWIPSTSLQAKFGNYSIALYATGNNRLSGYSNYVDIRGMDKATLSAWITIWNRTAGSFQAVVWFYNANKTLLSWTSWYETSTTNFGWMQISHTYTPSTDFPANTAYIRITFQWWAASSPYCTGDAYIDGVAVTFGDQVPAFFDNTAYSYNWCPEKLETISTTSISWSSTDWTNVLDLQFECESTMLIVGFAFMSTELVRTGLGLLSGSVKLTLDDVDISAASSLIYVWDAYGFEVPVNIHTVFTALKGTHHLKIAMKVTFTDNIIWGYNRRLSIMKGFYQGGTT